MTQQFRITPPYDLILRGSEAVPFGLYHLHLLTAEQVTRLYYSPNSLKQVQKRLKTLADHGYVQVDATPVKHHGQHGIFFSPRYYYALGNEGMRYLRRAGLDVHDTWRASKEVDKHALFLEHTLELNDVLISAAKLRQAEARYHLETLVHDRLLKRSPFEVKIGNRRVRLIPDAFLDFRFADKRLPLYLEHDRNSEQEEHFRRRIRVYIEWVKSGVYRERFGASVVTVAFTTFAVDRRLQQMRSWTNTELQSTQESAEVSGTFLFASLPPAPTSRQVWLEPCWYMASDNTAFSLLQS